MESATHQFIQIPRHSTTFDVLCGQTAPTHAAIAQLEAAGCHRDPCAPVKFVIDIQRGFALHLLDNRLCPPTHLIVVTFSFCCEYWEDLWDLGPLGLVVNDSYEHNYTGFLALADRGARFRRTPNQKSPLTRTERRVLQHVARGWSNRKISQSLSLQDQTVMNTLTSVYRKLGLANRAEATRHYWGVFQMPEPPD